MPPPDVRAAGAVVTRKGGDVLLVHRPRYDDWSFPKGKVDPGEHVAATAVRETWEETGLHVRLGPALADQRYPVAGKVSWITPPNASGGRTQGVGVRFPADEKTRGLKLKIEEVLGTSISSAKPTQTI